MEGASNIPLKSRLQYMKCRKRLKETGFIHPGEEKAWKRWIFLLSSMAYKAWLERRQLVLCPRTVSERTRRNNHRLQQRKFQLYEQSPPLKIFSKLN